MTTVFNAPTVDSIQLKLQQLIELDETDKIHKDDKTYLNADTVLKLLADSNIIVGSVHVDATEEETKNKDEYSADSYDEKNDELSASPPIPQSTDHSMLYESNKPQIKIDWNGYAMDHLRYEEDEKLQYYSNKDLFVILSKYLFIYSLPGNKKGEPRTISNVYQNGNKLSIIHILNRYDLILIAAQQRDYTTKKYVKCLLPVSGWIYLPEATIKKWINSDRLAENDNKLFNSNESLTLNDVDIGDIIDSKLSPNAPTNYKNINIDELVADRDKIDELHETLWENLEKQNHKNIDFLGQEIVPLTHPLPQFIFKDDFDIFKDENINIIQEKKGKCILTLISLVKWIIQWMRIHHWAPMLLIILIQAVIEVVIFTDIITDIIVILQLYKVSITVGKSATLFFMISVICLMAPYLIAWVATTQWMVRKVHKLLIASKLDKIPFFWKTCTVLFSIAPIGMFVLLIGDILHVLEYSIFRPLIYMLSLCINNKILSLRVVSFEELGYWKLRRVSEIFAESLPQSVLQLLLLILLSQSKQDLDINYLSVALAFFSSVIVTVFWCIVLLFESKTNGMSFVEYVTVVFQGSFKFVPYLPGIERGGKTGINVNWTQYRLDNDALGLVAKAFITPSCKISTLKISIYTIENLHRLACKYFGKTIAQYNDNKTLELIISRQEADIRHLFEIYDIDLNQNFDFIEFARCCIVMRKDVSRSVSLYNASELFWDLIGNENEKNEKNEIWLLDLLLKIRSSKQRISLLDYEHPLIFALSNNSVNLISLLIAANYHKQNEMEYKQCIIHAMVNDTKKERCVMALCEQKGIPIIVQVLSARLNKKCNPFVVVSIPAINIEIKSYISYNTNNPCWQSQYLLFIIPFSKMDKALNKS
eukprot:347360_1